MRKLFIPFVLLCLWLVGPTLVSAQALSPDEVPNVVMSTFKGTQPGTLATWAKGWNDEFEAKFSRNGTIFIYVYNEAGVLTLKKKSLNTAKLPMSVSNVVMDEYPIQQVRQTFQVLTPQRKSYYEVFADNGGNVDRMHYSLSGVQLHKESRSLAASGYYTGAIAMRGESKTMKASTMAPVSKNVSGPSESSSMKKVGPENVEPSASMRGMKIEETDDDLFGDEFEDMDEGLDDDDLDGFFDNDADDADFERALEDSDDDDEVKIELSEDSEDEDSLDLD